jgi:hypothetical protein
LYQKQLAKAKEAAANASAAIVTNPTPVPLNNDGIPIPTSIPSPTTTPIVPVQTGNLLGFDEPVRLLVWAAMYNGANHPFYFNSATTTVRCANSNYNDDSIRYHSSR